MKPKGGRTPNSPKIARDLRLQAQDTLLRPPPDCGGGGRGQQKGSRSPAQPSGGGQEPTSPGLWGYSGADALGVTSAERAESRSRETRATSAAPRVGPCSHSRSSKTTGEGLPVGAGAARLASGNTYPAPERALLEAAPAVGRGTGAGPRGTPWPEYGGGGRDAREPRATPAHWSYLRSVACRGGARWPPRRPGRTAKAAPGPGPCRGPWGPSAGTARRGGPYATTPVGRASATLSSGPFRGTRGPTPLPAGMCRSARAEARTRAGYRTRACSCVRPAAGTSARGGPRARWRQGPPLARPDGQSEAGAGAPCRRNTPAAGV